MVSFTPTEDQQLLIDTINRYAINDLREVAHEADEASEPALNEIMRGWEIGLVPTAIPEEMGGFGEMSAMTGVLAAEELAFGDLSAAMHLLTPALFAYPVVLYGTDEQKEEFLPLFLEEELAPATAALLEPGILFDPNEPKTTATADGDAYKISGTKAYVPLAKDAQHMLVYARDSESGKVDGYIVGKENFETEKRELLMGLRALPMFRVNFNDAAAVKLGGAEGCDYNAILARQNTALAAMAVGVARASFEYARDYAKERMQFGKAIAQNQAIAFMLAEVAIEIDAARLMAWEAAWLLDEGKDASKEAYLARQFGNETALFATDSGVQTLGGYGFIREYPVERWLRNGRGFTTFDGLAIV